MTTGTAILINRPVIPPHSALSFIHSFILFLTYEGVLAYPSINPGRGQEGTFHRSKVHQSPKADTQTIPFYW